MKDMMVAVVFIANPLFKPGNTVCHSEICEESMQSVC